MVKVKITRDCSIEGKHYSEGDLAEVIEKDARYLMAIGKAMAYDGKPEPKRAFGFYKSTCFHQVDTYTSMKSLATTLGFCNPLC